MLWQQTPLSFKGLIMKGNKYKYNIGYNKTILQKSAESILFRCDLYYIYSFVQFMNKDFESKIKTI